MSRLRSLLYQRLLRPLLFTLDAETAHDLVMFGLRHTSRSPALLRAFLPFPSALHRPVSVFGLIFPNVLGLAAGFDKNAVALPAWAAMGFGFAEVGTVTCLAQPGNPKPRLFRLPEHQAVINRMGFNNGGADKLACRLTRLAAAGRRPAFPIGINFGKSKLTPLDKAAEDYLYSFNRLRPHGDYFVVNVSSPNTPDLRKLQGKPELDALLGALQSANFAATPPPPPPAGPATSTCSLFGAGTPPPDASTHKVSALPSRPLLVKIAPDLSPGEIEDIIELAERHHLAGIVATNTTIDHTAVQPLHAGIAGGLSGEPLRRRSTEVVKFISSRTRLPIIAVGGVADVDSAREKLDAGATLLQLYTSLVYAGPDLVAGILAGLSERQ